MINVIKRQLIELEKTEYTRFNWPCGKADLNEFLCNYPFAHKSLTELLCISNGFTNGGSLTRIYGTDDILQVQDLIQGFNDRKTIKALYVGLTADGCPLIMDEDGRMYQVLLDTMEVEMDWESLKHYLDDEIVTNEGV